MTTRKFLILTTFGFTSIFACQSNLYRYSNWENFGEHERYSYRYYEFRKGVFYPYSLGFKNYVLEYVPQKNEFRLDSLFYEEHNAMEEYFKPFAVMDSLDCQRYFDLGFFQVKNDWLTYKGLNRCKEYSVSLKIRDTSYQSTFLLPFASVWLPAHTYSNGSFMGSIPELFNVHKRQIVGKHKFLVKYRGGNEELNKLFQINRAFEFGLPKLDVHLFDFFIDNPLKNDYTYPISIAFDAKTGIPVLVMYYLYYLLVDKEPTHSFIILDQSTTIKSSKEVRKYSMFRK